MTTIMSFDTLIMSDLEVNDFHTCKVLDKQNMGYTISKYHYGIKNELTKYITIK